MTDISCVKPIDSLPLRRYIANLFSAMGRKGEKAKTEPKQQDKITLYIDKAVIKEFKKLAIDEEKGFSELAEEAFEAYLKSHKKSS